MCARAEWTPEQGRGCVSAAPQQCSLWRPLGRARWRLAPGVAAPNPLTAGDGTVQGSNAELYCSPFSPRLQSSEQRAAPTGLAWRKPNQCEKGRRREEDKT